MLVTIHFCIKYINDNTTLITPTGPELLAALLLTGCLAALLGIAFAT